MNLKTTSYTTKLPNLPISGRHISAWYDDDEILVYIPHLGEYYGDKTVSRPVWFTPSFYWMMHHADWLDSPHYETIEYMSIQRLTFEEILFDGFPADYDANAFESEEVWKKQKAGSTVQYRWEADYSPDGQELDREALLVGVHSRTWMQYVMRGQITKPSEIDEALFQQKEHTQPPFDLLIVPDEQPYPLAKSVKEVLNISD